MVMTNMKKTSTCMLPKIDSLNIPTLLISSVITILNGKKIVGTNKQHARDQV